MPLFLFPRRRQTVAPPPTATITSYRFNNATWVASIGTANLTQNGTTSHITSVAGKLSNAARRNNTSNNSFLYSDSTDLAAGSTDWWLSTWIYIPSGVNSGYETNISFMGRGQSNNSTNLEWNLRYYWASDFLEISGLYFNLYSYVSGSPYQEFKIIPYGDVPLGQWNLVVLSYENTNRAYTIQLNNGTIYTNNLSNVPNVIASNGRFYVFKTSSGTELHKTNVMIDCTTYYKGGLITNTDRTNAWNSGTGVEPT